MPPVSPLRETLAWPNISSTIVLDGEPIVIVHPNPDDSEGMDIFTETILRAEPRYSFAVPHEPSAESPESVASSVREGDETTTDSTPSENHPPSSNDSQMLGNSSPNTGSVSLSPQPKVVQTAEPISVAPEETMSHVDTSSFRSTVAMQPVIHLRQFAQPGPSQAQLSGTGPQGTPSNADTSAFQRAVATRPVIHLRQLAQRGPSQVQTSGAGPQATLSSVDTPSFQRTPATQPANYQMQPAQAGPSQVQLIDAEFINSHQRWVTNYQTQLAQPGTSRAQLSNAELIASHQRWTLARQSQPSGTMFVTDPETPQDPIPDPPKRVACLACGKTSMGNKGALIHQFRFYNKGGRKNAHLKIPTYLCDTEDCGLSFHDRGTRDAHMMAEHPGFRPFAYLCRGNEACPRSWNGFSTRRYLDTHHKIIHKLDSNGRAIPQQ